MKKKAKSYSADFKQEAVRRMAQATTIIGLAKELGVRRKLLYQWRDQFQAEDRAGLERRRGRPPWSKSQTVSPPAPSAADLRIGELERLLGRFTLTQSSWTAPARRCSRKWMSGHAATALVLPSDRGQFRTLTIYAPGEPIPPSQGESPFPLDFYLSWMSSKPSRRSLSPETVKHSAQGAAL
jgi:transposase-like protein